MSRLDMAGLVEMVAKDRYPNHRRSGCQYEHDFYILHEPVKHTCNNNDKHVPSSSNTQPKYNYAMSQKMSTI